MLNPVFSIAHMRAMSTVLCVVGTMARLILTPCNDSPHLLRRRESTGKHVSTESQERASDGTEIVRILSSHLLTDALQIDVLSWMTRTALELVGRSGLGYSFDPLTENGKEHPYSVSVKNLVSVSHSSATLSLTPR